MHTPFIDPVHAGAKQIVRVVWCMLNTMGSTDQQTNPQARRQLV
jgi:hypothetical protein